MIGVPAAAWGQFFDKFHVVEFQVPDAGRQEDEDHSGRHTRIQLARASTSSMGEQMVLSLRSTAEPVYISFMPQVEAPIHKEVCSVGTGSMLYFTESLQYGGTYVIRLNRTTRGIMRFAEY
jgi:hypothetical protein